MTVRLVFTFPSKIFPQTVFHWGQHLQFVQWYLHFLNLTFPSLSFNFLKRNLCMGVRATCSLSTLVSTSQAGREQRSRKKKSSQRKIPASHSFDGRQLKHIHLFINTFHFSHGISMSSFLCSIAHCWWKPLLVTVGFSTFPRPHV